MKPRLLVLELWGLGDLALATPLLRAATEKYQVTLLAKPVASELQPRLWPDVQIIPFHAPWTAFRGKYRLWQWRWREILELVTTLRRQRFEASVSARWDPRDHMLQWLAGARMRTGFPRIGSRLLLTHSLDRPPGDQHRHAAWQMAAVALGIELPDKPGVPTRSQPGEFLLVHTGAARAVRQWPLERYQGLVFRLRKSGHRVVVACDPSQREWWLRAGEAHVATPSSVAELLKLTDGALGFIGNDSGPGHLAAACGVPTFTIFGPQLPALFLPLHPASDFIDGKPCPHKPCFDLCRFDSPHCLMQVTGDEVWAKVESFARRHADAGQSTG